MKRFQMMVIGALAAGFLLAAAEPVSAQQVVLRRDRSASSARLKPFQNFNRFKAEKGKNGRIGQARNLRLMQREKGSGGQIARDRWRRDYNPRFVNRNGFRTPIDAQVFFAQQRTDLTMWTNRAERSNRLRWSKGLVNNRLQTRFRVQRSVAFRPRQPVARKTAIDTLTFTRETLSNYVAANSIGSVLIQKDPVSGKTYRLQFAGSPVTKRISPTQAAIRCNFYGTDSPGAPTVPVVMELGMTGTGPTWRISDVRFVSVNGKQLPGTFAFSDDEFEGQAAVAAEIIEEKEFPTKSLSL